MRVLVAYYTRTGSTKRAAEVIAESLRAVPYEVELERIAEKKGRGGVFGWLGARADSTFKRETEIEPAAADVGSFDLVIAGTPIWAWGLTPPVRSFLLSHASEIRQAAFFCTVSGAGAQRAFEAMEEALDRTALATVSIVDRHVKENNESEFLGKVEEFVGDIVRAVGRGGTLPRAPRAGDAAASDTRKAAEGTSEEAPAAAPGRESEDRAGDGAVESPDAGNALTYEACAELLERFDGFRDAVLRRVQVSYRSGGPPWSARVLLTARDARPKRTLRAPECPGRKRPGGRDENLVDVGFSVEDVREFRLGAVQETEGKHSGERGERGEREEATAGPTLREGIRIGFLEDTVYLDLRPRSESSETLGDFMKSGLLIAGRKCTWTVGPRGE